ncbi:MAG: CPBP family intramembrane metalloprotease [Gammaproteobacteria bacterium]|nr:CPBP family intramembrane metalloprotease [Gammaproteobacteria bacterium]
MKNNKESYITLLTFFIAVIACYILGYWLIYRLGQATPLMLSVGVATLLTCWIRKRKLSSLGWQWGDWKQQRTNYLIPFCIAFVAYLIIWMFGFADFYNVEFVTEKKDSYNLPHWNDAAIVLLHLAIIATISFVVSLPSILGEEIGWRGFLVPELAKSFSFTGVALISGFVWALFHWPLIFLGLYGNEVTPLYYQLLVFTVFITATGVIMAYFRMKTNSVWPAVFYHGSSNIFIQKLFTPLTLTNEVSAWYIDEFGAVLAIVASGVAAYFLRKGQAEFTSLKNN